MSNNPELDALEARLQGCMACPLGATRDKLVFGAGNGRARIVLIGEAPGGNEDATGIPFVGAAGRILDESLELAGLSRDDIYIANVLKCRPPGNRDPEQAELLTCTAYLHEQLEIIRPKLIVALGAFASRFCIAADPSTPMYQMRGNVYQFNGYSVLCTYHPAACIYDRSKLPTLQADLQTAKRLVESAA